jgi:hypothetical protein
MFRSTRPEAASLASTKHNSGPFHVYLGLRATQWCAPRFPGEACRSNCECDGEWLGSCPLSADHASFAKHEAADARNQKQQRAWLGQRCHGDGSSGPPEPESEASDD